MKSWCSLHFKSWWFPVLTGIAISVQQIPVWACADDINQPGAHNFTKGSPFPGHPVSSFQINRPGYSLEYDASRRNPKWVYEHITPQSIKGNADRSHANFKEDESLPSHLRSTLLDYRKSGFDRGHMAPAADHRSSSEAMCYTFFLSNICPQSQECNRGHWAALEKYVRDLTKYYENVFVISGPLYLPIIEENGRRFVKYEVIGPNDVSVPTHFFKVISFEDRQGGKVREAYIMPNEGIHENSPLDSFKVSIEKVERAAGMIFTN